MYSSVRMFLCSICLSTVLLTSSSPAAEQETKQAKPQELTYDEGTSDKRRERLYWEKLIDVEMKFLAEIKDKPNHLKTGPMVLRFQFADKPLMQFDTSIKMSGLYFLNGPSYPFFENGQFQFEIISATPKQNNNAVYWTMSDGGGREYPPSLHFVGLIDGDSIHGHVYILQSNAGGGWSDFLFNIGVFSLIPKVDSTSTPEASAQISEGKSSQHTDIKDDNK